MTRTQKKRQLRRICESIMMCRERLDNKASGLSDMSRGNIETSMIGMERSRDYLELSLHSLNREEVYMH